MSMILRRMDAKTFERGWTSAGRMMHSKRRFNQLGGGGGSGNANHIRGYAVQSNIDFILRSFT